MSVDIQTIGFGADVSGLKDAQRELGNTERAANKTADGADKLGARFSALSSATSMLKGVLAGIGFAALGKQFVEVADAVSMMEARLKLATGNLADFAQAQQDVYRISQATQVGMQEVATLYTRMADPVRRLGGGVRETAAITEAFAQTLRISGASTAEASAATLQFSQAMAAGALRGDEFNSIAETSPRLLKVVAEALGTNAGALREMAADGKLTADVIGNALIGSLGQLRTEASSLPDTVSGVMTQLSNLTQTLVGEFNNASGATGGLAGILKATLVPALKVAYTAVASLYATLQSVAHVWVGVLSAANMALQREFKLAFTMLKQIPIDIEKTGRDTAASISRVWSMGLEGSEETTGALKTLKGALGQTAGAAKGAEKEVKALLERERQMRELIEKAQLADDLREENKALEERLRLARMNNDLFDEEFAKRERARVMLEGGIKSAREMVDAIRFETEMLGLSNTEREVAIALRQAETQGLEKGSEAYATFAARIREAIEARAATRGAVESAAEFQREWQRVNDQIGQSLSNALMQGGKSGAEYLKGAIRAAFAKPIQVLLQPVTNAITVTVMGMLPAGSVGSAGAGGLPVGSIPGAGSMLGSAALWAGSTLGAGTTLGGFATGIGTALSSGAGTAASWAAGSALAGTTGGAAAGAGMMAGAALPWVGAALLASSLLSKGGETRAGGGYGYSSGGSSFGTASGLSSIWSDEIAGVLGAGQTRFLGGPSGGEIGQVRETVAATVAGINDLFDRLGSTERVDEFWGKLEQSTKGRGGVFAGGTLASGASFGESSWEAATSRTLSAEEAMQAFALDLKQSTIQALQAASDIPAAMRDILTGVDAEALTDEQANAVLATVQAFVALQGAAELLSVPIDSLTAAMISAGGGVDALAANVAGYYQNFYSEAERTADATAALAEQFAAIGIAMPGTREAFRGLVESLDLTTSDGQAAYGALMSLSGAFAAVIPAADATAASIGAMVGAMTQAMSAAVDQAAGWPTADDWVRYAEAVADPQVLAATLSRSFGEAWAALDLGDAFPAPTSLEQYKATIASLDIVARESLPWAEKLDGALNLAPEFARLVQALDGTAAGVEQTVNRLNQAVSTLANLQSLYTQEEYKAMMAPLLAEQFATIITDGTAMPTTAAAMRTLVESITDPGVKASLAEFVGQWDDFYVSVEKVSTAASSASRSVNTMADQMRSSMQSLADFTKSLFLSDVAGATPEQQLAAASQLWTDAVSAVDMAKTPQSLQQLQQAAQAYLTEARDYGASGSMYQSIRQAIIDTLTRVTGVTPAGMAPSTGSQAPAVVVQPDDRLWREQKRSNKYLRDSARAARLAMAAP